MTNFYFNWNDLEWIQVDENIRRKQIWLDKLMHVLVEIKSGGKAPMHGHPHEQTGYLLQGTLKVFLGDDEKIISAGEGYLVPPNVFHGVEVISEEEALIFDTFTPQREDFK